MNQSHRSTALPQVQQKAAPMDEDRPLSPASWLLEYDTSEAGMLPYTHVTALSCQLHFSTTMFRGQLQQPGPNDTATVLTAFLHS